MTLHAINRRLFLPALLLVLFALALAASPAFAAGEPHPLLSSFERSSGVPFADPNGIAVDEATGAVYVAEIGTDTIYKYDSAGSPVDFTDGSGAGTNALIGAATPAASFAFPGTEKDTPAALAVDNSTSPLDPSKGDLYVMDAGHGVVDKFNAQGKYLSQITGFNPAGSGEHELLGLAVDANGTLRIHLNQTSAAGSLLSGGVAIDEFDDSTANSLIAKQVNEDTIGGPGAGTEEEEQKAQIGFTVGPTGDNYLLYGGSCSCVVKFGQQLAALGQVDSYRSGAVAIAADPATGHVYIDDQSSVGEWDTGATNGSSADSIHSEGDGTLVSSFGSEPGQLSASAGEQAGIAVDGASGDVYVSNPANGEVYVFGSDAPAVAADAPSEITKETATLHGTVNPRGEALSACEFDYGIAEEFGRATYEHKVACNQTPSGTSAVPVSADIAGLSGGLLYRFRLKAINASGTEESSGLLATQGEGFGIKKFEMSSVNEDGSPDTQAGSHPYALLNTIEFNSHYMRVESNADSMYAREPDGTLKDLRVDLPPGLVGDPNATKKKCTLNDLDEGNNGGGPVGCPAESYLGQLQLIWAEHVFDSGYKLNEPVFNMAPPYGVAAQFGIQFINPDLFLNSGLLAGGNYPIQTTESDIPPAAPVIVSHLTLYGVVPDCVYVGEGAGKYATDLCRERGSGSRGVYEVEPGGKPFLTLPTACNGPLRSSISIDSYQEPGHWIKPVEALSRNVAGQPVSVTGCSKLEFPPEVSVAPDTTDASSPSGLTVHVKVPQTAALNPNGLAESALRDTTVALPAGVAINPSGGGGLEACTSEPAALAAGALGSPGDQIGYKGQEELNGKYEPGVQWSTFTSELASPLAPGSNFCPNGSKVGTVKIKTPLLEHELEGSVYLATQNNNPFESLIAMYIVAEDPFSGSLVKLAGAVRLCEGAGEMVEGVTCAGAGQIVTTFKNSPDTPFEDLELHFFGGERAPLATPSRCGTYTTTALFTPWDGNGPVTSESSFNIERGPGGGPCPGATLPFSPSVNAGATNIQAGAFSPLTVTMNRKDGEQNLKSIEAHLPPGLSGVLAGVELCPEPQANLGECGPNSLVGEATISVGVGNQPFTVTGGKFYLTGPYNGHGTCTVGEAGCAPFGLTFEVPAKAGPFDLANTANNHPACDCVVVRGKIELNPLTSAITITSDPPGSPDSIPTSIEGIPLEIQHVNATTTRGNFQFNPTSCAKMALTATLQLNEGGSSTLSTPFQVTNCAALKFEPKFSVSTSGKTSKASGASLTAKLTYPNVPQGTDADIARVKVELPKQLPSRLTTLQKACTDKQFEANPAGCPAASMIGYATVHTPLIPVPLQGPVIFVSHGGEAFPSLTMVLQGYGITIDLVGTTFISKAGVTSTTFKTVPDQPFSSFELTLPEGPYSALAANGNLCGKKLTMPTEFVAQNGAEIHETTNIGVTTCAKTKTLTRAQKLAAALKACHKDKRKARRSSCERAARKKYGPVKAKKKKKK